MIRSLILWSMGSAVRNARRNFPTDTDGTTHLASRRLRSTWPTDMRLDGNLQLPSESLWVAYANADCNGDSDGYGNCYCNGHGYCNCHGYTGTPATEAYADAQAASHTAASAVRSALAYVSSGTRDQLASPRIVCSLLRRSPR